MKHGSLFSGIGGFDYAAQMMGWENLFHCEWNEFGQKVLKHHWPQAESFHDITKTDFTPYANRIDILTGGFPCQPYSLAGKRKGKEDERHLWPEMLRAIREIQPRWVVGENVFGLVNWSGGLVFHEVQADLETAGYEVFPYVLPAAAVNAPHRRDRIWFVAHAIGQRNTPCGSSAEVEGIGRGNNGQQKEWCEQTQRTNGLDGLSRNAANASNQRLEGCKVNGSTGSSRTQRNEQFARYVPSNWQNFPTQPPICTGNDGFSTKLDGITFPKWRNESIKAAGNAIVPQVAFQIFKTIQDYENL